MRVRVWCHTAKRVGIILGGAAPGRFDLRYVKPERLERVPGGLIECP